MKTKLMWVLVVGLSVLLACPSATEAELAVSAKPKTIDNAGQVSTISVTATDAKGQMGQGTVRLTSAVGSLTTPVEVALVGGIASAEFSCAGCTAGSQRITAEWLSANKLIEGTVTVTVTGPADAGTGGGSGGGTGGGATGGGATGGGSTGGGSADGGLSLRVTTARPNVFLNVGDFAPVTATLTRGGRALAGEVIDFSTNLGLLQPDGGAQAATTSATTDSNGAAYVTFKESGSAGIATVSATNATTGATGGVAIEVLAVQSISHTATTCGSGTSAMGCSIMGIRGSGFNESANVKFKVLDSKSRGVTGVRVAFSIVNSPIGTTVTPEGYTDANGEVVANVVAGPTIGSFNIHAVVIPGMIETDSSTIGIRGAKPSNYGFSLQCAKVNIAAYRSAKPPLDLTVSCKVTLVDRYGNPVGTGTSVNLKSEAGVVPSSAATQAFSAMGTNDNEGRGTFNFNTVGKFPAIDLDPLEADPTQYPYARAREPRHQVGQLTLNPRDGLVTVIAYVRGEEHFFDDNNNGQRDENERFIDQGEPFVDLNDNNQWDQGEVYVDESPADGKWNAPNGKWDSNVTIWTVTHILYTDETDPSIAYMSPGSSWVVPKGGSVPISAFLCDKNYNLVEGGSALTCRHTATKGSLIVRPDNSALDGYGFGFEARRLVSADGTADCTPSTLVCVFRTLFGEWHEGYIGGVEMGVTSTDAQPPQNDSVTCETNVRGAKAGAVSTGVLQ